MNDGKAAKPKMKHIKPKTPQKMKVEILSRIAAPIGQGSGLIDTDPCIIDKPSYALLLFAKDNSYCRVFPAE